MTRRGTRYQAAVLSESRLLLLRCRLHGGHSFWLLPGGGRESNESEVECIVREVREEAGIEVAVESMLYEIPADPPDGTYTLWRTYHCTILSGEARPGGGEAIGDLTAVRWLALDEPDTWESELRADPYLFPQLLRIRAALNASNPSLELHEEPMSELHRHVLVPSTFEADTVLEVVTDNGGIELREQRIATRYRKDYDAVEDPKKWPTQFDVSNWTLIVASNAGERVGGAIGAFLSPGLDMLEGRDDLAVLWDIRVSPAARRLGVGSALFRSIEAWARAKHCRDLKVETQNTNVAACRLYAREGCQLERANYHAYPSLPDEVQLIWSKRVGA